MKTLNVTLAEINAAIAATPGLAGNAKFVLAGAGDQGNKVEGYIKLSTAGKLIFGSKVKGAPHYGPCPCGWAAFHASMKQIASTYGWRYTVNKHVLKASTYTSSVSSKLASSIACAHGVMSAASDIATPAAEPAEPTGAPCTIAPLAGDLLTDGETDELTQLRGMMRPVFAVTATMYVVDELYAAAMALRVPVSETLVPDNEIRDYHAKVAWAKRVVAYRRGFAERLARNFFDYLILSAYSEVCHSASGFGSHYKFAVRSTSGAGGNIIPECRKYDPRTLLPRMAWCFRQRPHAGGYGGEKWAKICDAAGLFYQFASAPIAFADHCVDLAHNGGLAFNKGYILRNPSDEHAYMAMLTAKRNGSLLAGKAALTLTPAALSLVYEAVACGIIPRPACALSEKEDVSVPTVKWGAREFAPVSGKHAMPAPDPDDAPVIPPHITSAPAVGGKGHGTLAPAR